MDNRPKTYILNPINQRIEHYHYGSPEMKQIATLSYYKTMRTNILIWLKENEKHDNTKDED